jgi:hypothetical protein
VNGAIYIITQDARYVDLVRASAASLKRAMPDLPVTVFSQFAVDGPFDQLVLIDGTESQMTAAAGSQSPAQRTSFGTLRTADGFYDKARFMLQSPYDRTIFLDADIYVAEAFPELFALLDRFDCAVNHEEYLNTDWFGHYPRPDIPKSFPEFNTGVLAYKNSEAMQSVLRSWCHLYQEYRRSHPDHPVNDQPFFREAMYYSDARVATLTREYNCKFRGQGYLNGRAKLLHGHVNFKLPDKYMDRVARLMNSSDGPRVYIANQVYAQETTGLLVGRRRKRKLGKFPDPDPIFVQRMRRLKRIVKEQGAKSVVRKLFSRMPRLLTLPLTKSRKCA